MEPILSSANIKRQVLSESDMTGIRKRYKEQLDDKKEELYLETGECLAEMTRHKGWAFLEAYMMKQITSSLLTDDQNPYVKGFINIMHYIDQMVRIAEEIREAKDER